MAHANAQEPRVQAGVAPAGEIARIVKGTWIDISAPVHTGMAHWPGDPEVRIERLLAIDRGEGMNLSAISMSLHTGTHIDAPLHFLERGAGIGHMPFSATLGRARVIRIRNRKCVTPEELRAHRIRRGERLLFKTRNSALGWSADEFVRDFVAISPGAARYLAARGVQTVGIDCLSVGSAGEDGGETHRILLSAGIWIIEGLNLASVQPGSYDLICLPLKIPESDGAPARAIIRRAK